MAEKEKSVNDCAFSNLNLNVLKEKIPD